MLGTWDSGNSPTPREDIINAVHELAEALDRLPSKYDWRHWDDRPCDYGAVEMQFGSWKNVWSEAGLATVATGAPAPIRAAAYQRPELAGHEVDE